MNWNVICAIYLHLCIGLVVVAVTADRILLQADADGNVQRTKLGWMTGKEQKVIADTSDAAATASAGRRELFFGVLLPSYSRGHRRCVYEAVLPAMDLAIKKIQRPGGLLAGYNITMEHRDTRCSSTYGPLAAFELFTKRKPGSVI